MTVNTIEQVKAANKAAGRYFFSPSTMRFFKSRVCGQLYPGGYFVTSEKGPHGRRKYTIRQFDTATTNIETVSAFQQYASLSGAKKAAQKLAQRGLDNA